MRTLLVGVVSGFVALVGLASTAHSAVTIDLLWGGTSATTSSVGTSSSLVLAIVLTNDGPLVSRGASVTVDYSAAVEILTVTGFQSIAGGPFLPISVFPATDTGTQIRNINALSLPMMVGLGLSVGQSYLLGTIQFHKEPGNGSFVITSLFTAKDGAVDINGAADPVTFNSATLNNIPEPTSVSLVTLGLTGLALVVRRKN